MAHRRLPARAPRPLALLLLLLAVAGGAVVVVASRSPFATGRQLLTTNLACSQLYQTCSTCQLCPYDCITLCGSGINAECRDGDPEICTNFFRSDEDLPTLPINNVSIDFGDQDLCSDWAQSNAAYLAPMYDGGRCTNRRLGALYAVYDCVNEQVCFKATSCVGNITKGADGPNGGTNIDGYECPGVACGCASESQADAQCVPFDEDTSQENDWFFLNAPCGTTDRENDIEQGYSPSSADGGRISGWEFCANATADTIYSVHAHFNVFAGEPGENSNTVGTQFPGEDQPYIKFKTPVCPPSTCPSVSGSSVSVCPDDMSVTASFTITSSGGISITYICPNGTSVTETRSSAVTNEVLPVTCVRPATGWSSSNPISIQVQESTASDPPCTAATATASITVKPQLTVTVEAVGTPPKICYTATTAVATFTVTVDDAGASLLLEPDAGCTNTTTGTRTTRTVTVTCTNSAGYKASPVPIRLNVTATKTGKCPDVATLTQDVVVRGQPSLTISKPQDVCVQGKSFTAEFAYTATTTRLSAVTSWDETVTPLKSDGTNATDVTCTAPVYNTLASTVTTTCSLVNNGDFETSGVDFVGVKLSITAEDKCGNAIAPADATLDVKLAPSIDLVVDSAPDICSTDANAVAIFNYTASNGAVSLSIFTVISPSTGCTRTLNTGRKQVTVTCPKSISASKTTIVLNATLPGTSPCGSATDEATAEVTTVQRADLNVTAPANSTICFGSTSGSTTFTYEVSNALSIEWTVSPSSCSVTGSGNGQVNVTCNSISGFVEVTLRGNATSRTPCADVIKTAVTKITVDTAPTVSLTPETQTLTDCAAASLSATFTYSYTSNVGGAVNTTAFVTLDDGSTKDCTVTGPPTGVLNATTASKTGTLTVSCPGPFSPGDSPSITVTMEVNKKDCPDFTDTAVANFNPLQCCVLDGTSYAAVILSGVRTKCFKDDDSTCPLAGATNMNWGFYINNTIIGTNSIQLITGGGNNCNKGSVVGSAAFTCTADGTTGKPTGLTISVTNFLNSVLRDQHYYVGCRAVTTCSPPAFGGVTVQTSTRECTLGGSYTKSRTTIQTPTCGGKFPTTATVTTGEATRTTSFTVPVNQNTGSTANCNSCDDVVWVVHQSGDYKGDPSAGQCAGIDPELAIRSVRLARKGKGKGKGKEKGKRRNP